MKKKKASNKNLSLKIREKLLVGRCRDIEKFAWNFDENIKICYYFSSSHSKVISIFQKCLFFLKIVQTFFHQCCEILRMFKIFFGNFLTLKYILAKILSKAFHMWLRFCSLNIAKCRKPSQTKMESFMFN